MATSYENHRGKLHPHQSGTDVELLIGCNCPRAIKPRELILGRGDDPYAVRTLLGWGIISPITPLQEGQESKEDTEVTTCHRIMSCEIASDTPASLSFVPKVQSKEAISPNTEKKMFEMDCSERNSSQEDRKFLAVVESKTHQYEDSHYKMPLPLRVPTLNLQNNHEVALHRLNQLKRRFRADKKYKDNYTAFMENMINSGFAEKVPSAEVEVCGEANPNHSQGKVWYIPNHGMYYPEKPTKIRVVFDCSAEYQNESLNKHLQAFIKDNKEICRR